MRQFLKFIRANQSLLAFGVLLTFFSSYGQTFLISLYIPHLEAAFQFSSTGISSLYAIATTASAFCLPWVGRLVDIWPLPRFTGLVLLGLAFACLLLSLAVHPIMVLGGFFALRFFGQGLMSHTSISTMARAFSRDRGKAISLATLGHPLGEATLPLLVAFLIGVVGWRTVLQGSSVSVLILVAPLAWFFLRKQSKELLIPTPGDAEEVAAAKKPWRVFGHRAFWIIAPAVFITGFLNTAIFFFQLKLGEARDWSPTWVAGSLSVYAIASALSMMGSGPLVDRLSAKYLFPVMLVPYILGITILATVNHPLGYPSALVLIAISNGGGSTIKNALFAELFGTRIIGTVRSVFTMVMVFSTALGPVSFGLLLDARWAFSSIFWGSGIILVLIILWSIRIKEV